MDETLFLERGYAIAEAEDIGKLNQLKDAIFKKAKDMVGYKGNDAEAFFNNFHKHNLKGASLNDKRMEIIKHCTQNLDVGKTIYEVFPNAITQLIGPDIVTQRTTNLVIQQPHDPDVGPTHRDSPLNSPFEIIVWVPLVNVYGTKSMYVLDREKSKEALKLLKDNESGYEKYMHFASQHGQNVEIPFGKALFFWPGLVHGIPVNTEDETRWSLNMRYKNIFSPCGSKGLVEFFDMLRLSPLTRTAFDYEREAYG